MTGRFLTELRMRKPILTEPLNHRNFALCKERLESLARMLPPESAILIVGPSHCGKSFLLAYFISFLLQSTFANSEPRYKPVIGFTAQTSREGRTAPKFALHELLEDVGHPFFQPHLLDGKESPYRPTIRYDETFCLRALKSALHAANVSVVVADDAHYLVRSKDESFKASLLESFKSLITPRTTLVMCGGYELADVALSHRAHFATRVIMIHLPRYQCTEVDQAEWLGVLGDFSRSPMLRLDDPDLLVSNSAKLLHECHGVVGLLEKRLIDAQALADARDTALSATVLEETRPTMSAWETIRNDIGKGESMLGMKIADVVPPTDLRRNEAVEKKPASRKQESAQTRRAPFERIPRRTQPAVKT